MRTNKTAEFGAFFWALNVFSFNSTNLCPKKGNKLSVYATINYNLNKRCREAFVAAALISAACCQVTASIPVLIAC